MPSSRLALLALTFSASLFGCSAPPHTDGSADGASDATQDVVSEATDAPNDMSLDVAADAAPCATDVDCSDHVFCNGVERCSPMATAADARGCIPASPANPCAASETCDESMTRCVGSCDTMPDADGDGHRATACGGDDCDDHDAMRFPGNTEVCDSSDHDEDCDAMTFANPVTRDGDTDMDGYVATRCGNTDRNGMRFHGLDCDDTNPNVHPTQAEVCNGTDDDCNGMTDEGVLVTFYRDGDMDLHGDGSMTMTSCNAPAGYVRVGDDCDDTQSGVHPGATEVCNMRDDNCNGSVDEGVTPCSCVEGSTMPCGRNVGICTVGTQTCTGGSWQTCTGTPAGTEVCNGMDDNCNGTTDEAPAASSCASRPSAMVMCTAGACRYACNAGFADCNADLDAATSNGCETAVNTLSNCGGCGMACTRANAAPTCASGLCAISSCNTGFANCDGVDTNGCETPVNTLTNCGTCGSMCTRSNATASCTSRVCAIGTCNTGFGNCDGVDTNGCETMVNTVANCGGCGMACSRANATPTCTSSRTCAIGTCNTGYGNCDTNDANGCETAFNSVSNCGGCGTTCTRANATPTCSTGACAIGMCNANFGNCDGSDANGCESPLTTLTNCHTCGTACTRANATPTCTSGSCAIASCNPGFGNCDMVDGTGCEHDLRTDANNCGACGRICTTMLTTADPACVASNCTIACHAGYVPTSTMTDCLPVGPPRLTAPISGAVVTSNRPMLRFVAGGNATGAEIQVCRDSACGTVLQTLRGTTNAQPTALTPGTYFWRGRGTNGTVTGSTWSAPWEFFVFATTTPAGNGTSGFFFDGNRDGYSDVVIGAWSEGYEYTYPGSATGLPASAPISTWTLSSSYHGPHQSIAASGDFDGDGLPDHVIGSCQASTTAPGSYDPALCSNYAAIGFGNAGFLRVTGTTFAATGATGFGYSVSGAGDVDGDGYGDVVVGAFDSADAYIFFGSSDRFATGSPVRLTGPAGTGSFFGVAVAGAGDLNGDGYADVVVGAYADNAAYVFFGNATRTSIQGSRITRAGTVAGSNFGLSVAGAGDVNGDGYADIAVSGNGAGGVVDIFLGQSASPGLGTTAFRRWTSMGGISVIGVQDTNGDGYADLLVGGNGVAYLYRGGTTGGAPAPTWSFSSAALGFGRFVGAAGLVNNDGYADLIINACNQPGSCASTASIYLGSTSTTTPTAYRTYSVAGVTSFGRGVIR